MDIVSTKMTNVIATYVSIGSDYCVCVKRKMLCNWPCCCSSSCDSTVLIRNIGKFGAKSYFTDHRTANTIHGFGGSVPVLKIHGCY